MVDRVADNISDEGAHNDDRAGNFQDDLDKSLQNIKTNLIHKRGSSAITVHSSFQHN